jgi:heme/copper-type cytochrome/quinol oxidase subunit 3
MLFCLGFLSMFLIGGLTGIMLGAAPFNLQLTDTYFVVGHFHFVLIGGTLFGVMAGIHYWYPKVTGRMLSERLARWQFWLLYVGFILTFGTMHITGVLGMPRRIYTYDADRGWAIWNQLTTVGATIQAISFVFLLYNLVASLCNGRLAGADPWDAWTLEWTTTSPPPEYNFDAIPTVRSRRPLWDQKHPDDPDWKYEGVASPESVPRLSSLSPLQWGILTFLVSEVALFGTLIVVYVFYIGKDVIDPTPAKALSLSLVTVTTACLLSSSVTVHLADKTLGQGNRRRFLQWWAATILLGLIFLVGTAFEWRDLIDHYNLTISRNLFGTTYYTLVGLHATHVTVGVIILLLVLAMAFRRRVTAANRAGVGLASWYWHFVDGVWVVVFSVVYLLGR